MSLAIARPRPLANLCPRTQCLPPSSGPGNKTAPTDSLMIGCSQALVLAAETLTGRIAAGTCHSPGSLASRDRKAHRLAHVSAQLLQPAGGEWGKRQGRTGV